MTNEEIGSGVLPNVYFERININGSADNLSKDILSILVIREIFDEEGKGTWYNTPISQYAKIKVVQVMTQYEIMGYENPASVKSEELIKSLNMGTTSPADVGIDTENPFVQISEISLMSPDNNIFSNHTDRDGNTISDIYYSVSTPAILANVKDFYLYAVIYIDLVGLGLSNYDFALTKKYIGYANSEVIYKNGEVINTAFYFVNKSNGKIWPGPVHINDQSEWMGGAAHTEDLHPTLTRHLIPNPKQGFGWDLL